MKYSSRNSHEIIPMEILGVSLDFHSACTLECAMKTSWICNCCIMKILWYSYEKHSHFDTLVKLLYTCTRMSNRVEHQHSLPFLHAYGIFLPSPIPTVFTSCAYAICVHNHYTIPIPYATLQWAPQKLIKIFNCHIEIPSNCFPKRCSISSTLCQLIWNRISPQYIATCTFCLKCRTELLKLS